MRSSSKMLKTTQTGFVLTVLVDVSVQDACVKIKWLKSVPIWYPPQWMKLKQLANGVHPMSYMSYRIATACLTDWSKVTSIVWPELPSFQVHQVMQSYQFMTSDMMISHLSLCQILTLMTPKITSFPRSIPILLINHKYLMVISCKCIRS